MPEVQEISNIRKDFRGFFLVSKFCGINYFTLPIDRYGKPHIGLGDIVSFLFCLCAYAWIGYYNFAINITSISTLPSIKKIYFQFLIFWLVVNMFTVTIINLLSRDKIARMLVDLEKFDWEVTLLKILGDNQIKTNSKFRSFGMA